MICTSTICTEPYLMIDRYFQIKRFVLSKLKYALRCGCPDVCPWRYCTVNSLWYSDVYGIYLVPCIRSTNQIKCHFTICTFVRKAQPSNNAPNKILYEGYVEFSATSRASIGAIQVRFVHLWGRFLIL